MATQDFSIDELMQNRSFRNWVEGSATRQEQQFWDDWIKKSEHNRNIAVQAQQQMMGLFLERGEVPDAPEIWKTIDSNIEEQEQESGSKQKTLHPFGELHAPALRSSGFKQLLRVAAVIAIVFGGSLAWYFTSVDSSGEPEYAHQVARETITTGYAEQKRIALSDGSEIVLNAHSELSYSVDPHHPLSVDVTLAGEAWFSVASRHGQENKREKAFRVYTDDGTVSVLGTRFVVSARNETTRVVLEEGEIAVTPYGGDESGKPPVLLKPDELAEFSRFMDKVAVRTVNPLVYTSWKNPTLVFDQTPVREVIERIEQTFGVEVVVRDPGVPERTISGTVENTGLDAMVSILGQTLAIPAEIVDETVYLGR